MVFQIGFKLCKGVYCVDLCESFHISIYYLLAKIGFDTAENEPCKVCPLSAYRSPRFYTLFAGGDPGKPVERKYTGGHLDDGTDQR